MLSRIRKKDTVLVIAGKDKGKKGEVLAINTKANKVMVKGIGLLTKHVKARRQDEKSGIIKEESFINLSNVMPICTSCKKHCRVQVKLASGSAKEKRVRICSSCKEAF